MENIFYNIRELNLSNFWNDLNSKKYKSVIIEIGCSDGLVLTKMATKHIDCLIIGIELRNRSAQMAAGRINAEKIKNAIIINGDANDILSEGYFPNESISEVHIYFPSPNSIIIGNEYIPNINNKEFAKNVHSIVKKNGVLKVLTDHPRFFKYFNSIMDRNKWQEIEFLSEYENIDNGLQIESGWEYLCYFQKSHIYTLQLEKK